MLFNSWPFVAFFSVFFFLYWFAFQRNLKLQNLLILVASYFFYACWDWRFLFLLMGCSGITYFVGLQLPDCNEKKKKILLWVGVLIEILILIYFKYTNFFITSFIDLFHLFGINLNIHTLRIILPLGISFYIFRTLSYILDIYYGKIKPETNIIIFFSYVAFFPSLVCGPIDRGKLLIPQLKNIRTFNYSQASDGAKQILWGLFKKVVIADNAAVFTDLIFKDYQSMPSGILLLGAFLYTIQLYTDFSGYSDMAIGLSNLLGIRITKNFNFPFFSQNIADYWRRWHISLTNWLTDFIFTPLSLRYRDLGKTGLILSIIITFLVSGIWHGANWTYVLWGFLHGCYYIPLILSGSMNKKKKLSNAIIPSFTEVRNITLMFILIMFTNIIFRSENIATAYDYITSIFSDFSSDIPYLIFEKRKDLIALTCFIFITILFEWFHKEKEYGLRLSDKVPTFIRWIIYYMLILAIYIYQTVQQSFIYFQF